MRLPTFSGVLPALVLATSAAAAAAREATVLLSNNGHRITASQRLSVSPFTARMIFAQRLDVAQYHSLGDADAQTIEALNQLGGKQKKLFAGHADTDRRQALIMYEGVEAPEDFMSSVSVDILTFTVQNPPEQSANLQLLRDFNQQAGPRRLDSFEDAFANGLHSLLEVTKEMGSPKVHSYGNANEQRIFVDAVAPKASSSEEYRQFASNAKATITQLFQLAKDADAELIIAFMPPQTSSGGLLKRASTAKPSWGKYSLPKRQDAEEESTFDPELGSGRPDRLVDDLYETNVGEEDYTVPQSYKDLGLEAEAEAESTYESEGGFDEPESWVDRVEEFVDALLEDLNPLASGEAVESEVDASQVDTSPPSGILPACFNTFDSCLETTRNCSGHGSCYLKFTNRDATGGRSGECYACGCSATVRTNDDGTEETTTWGGPACQKVDISSPFWLLAGITVGLVSVISWGIGLLMSMGAQDLPSVLSAGVSSMPPRK